MHQHKSLGFNILIKSSVSMLPFVQQPPFALLQRVLIRKQGFILHHQEMQTGRSTSCDALSGDLERIQTPAEPLP